MQLLADATDSATSLQVGRELLDVVPGVLRVDPRGDAQQSGGGIVGSAIPHALLPEHYEGASLSAVADHLDLSLPAMSRMVNGLVLRGICPAAYRQRRPPACFPDAQRKGKAAMGGTRRAAEPQLAAELEKLSPLQRQTDLRGDERVAGIVSYRSITGFQVVKRIDGFELDSDRLHGLK